MSDISNSDSKKKIIIIASILLFLLVGAIVITKIFFPKQEAPVAQTEESPLFGNAPTSTITIAYNDEVSSEMENTYIDSGVLSASTTISAVPKIVDYGRASKILWKSEKDSICTSSGDPDAWFFTNGSPEGAYETGPLYTSRTYRVTCTYPDQSQVTKDVFVAVREKPTVFNYITRSEPKITQRELEPRTSTSFFSGLFNNTSGEAGSTGSGSKGKKPIITSLTSDPALIEPGTSATISWTSTDAESCATGAGNVWEKPSQNLPPQGSTKTLVLNNTSSVNPKRTMLVLSCTGAGGTTQKTISLTINPQRGPLVVFYADPPEIKLNERKDTTLSWEITGAEQATGCKASGGWSGDKGFSQFHTYKETVSVSTSGQHQFYLECTGAKGKTIREVSILAYLPPPVITMSVIGAYTQLTKNGEKYYYSFPATTGSVVSPLKIEWSSNQSVLCKKTGNWSGDAGDSGSDGVVFKSPMGTERYGLTCTNGANEASAAVKIRDGAYYERDKASDALGF